jgi:hypothetical protein
MTAVGMSKDIQTSIRGLAILSQILQRIGNPIDLIKAIGKKRCLHNNVYSPLKGAAIWNAMRAGELPSTPVSHIAISSHQGPLDPQ